MTRRPTPRSPSASRVTQRRITARVAGGKTAIPRDGAVVSFGGASPPPPSTRLGSGTRVRVRETWETEPPPAAALFARADDVVGGAGLLAEGRPRHRRTGRVERTSDSLRTVRHPRTMIGTDARGTIWLVTVDGRQPGYSVGVTIAELSDLALALGLTNALNLDGGGSTTMVVGGRDREPSVRRDRTADGQRRAARAATSRPAACSASLSDTG